MFSGQSFAIIAMFFFGISKTNKIYVIILFGDCKVPHEQETNACLSITYLKLARHLVCILNVWY